MKKYLSFLPLFFLFLILSCNNKPVDPIVADIVVYNGTICDGSGQKPYVGSIGIKDDRLIYVGEIQFLIQTQQLTQLDFQYLLDL